MKTNSITKTPWIAAVLVLASNASLAGSVGPLTTFTAGTTARASEVNGNFNALSTAVNDNHVRITVLETTTTGGNIVLQDSTAATGNILKGTAPFLHNFGTNNTFLGGNAGNFTTTGTNNTVIGADALQSNTIGASNTANGMIALRNNTSGSSNTAIGTFALQNNTTGSANIAIGASAGTRLTTGSNNIVIGNLGVAGESATIRIGASQTRAFIDGIRGVTTGLNDAIPVGIDSAGQLGTVSSSRRVKDDIADMGEASSVLRQLRPVTFYYKSDKNPKGRRLQYGLIAEEVDEVAPDLVARTPGGEIETVFYQHLTPMLLNEYQKQQRLIDAQAARVAELEQERRMQVARIEKLEKEAAHMAMVLGRLERAGLLAAASR